LPELVVLYWRDIPAQVIAKAGRRSAKQVLSSRFEQAIDRAAMKAKLRDSDAYLAQWRRGEPNACGPDLENEASRLMERLEAEYDSDRLERLIAAGGLAEPE